ncbi:histidine kinase [Melioribacter sp. Ez-97]|uniref:histidine kinase n=1 Tax=Melioribacter sp. Ez-97 TaxID=3423434 RepID=UPI003ED98E3D
MKIKNELTEIKNRPSEIKYFLPFVLLLALIAGLNTLQEYFVFHKTKRLFSLFMSNLVYNWYLILLAIAGYLIINAKIKIRLVKAALITIAFTFLIITHQVLQRESDLFFINKADYTDLYDMLIVNPQVWTDYGLCILFVAAFYSIQTRKKIAEKEVNLYKMHEELARIELSDTHSKIQPELIDNALVKMKSLIAGSDYGLAEELLTELSDYIRLILYNKEDYIDVDSQVLLIKKYIGLRKILFDENIKLVTEGLESSSEKKLPSNLLFYAVKKLLQKKTAEDVTASDSEIIKLDDNNYLNIKLENETLTITNIYRQV